MKIEQKKIFNTIGRRSAAKKEKEQREDEKKEQCG